MSNTVADLPIDFADLISDAELNASTDWEVNFISEYQAKFLAFGKATFVSPKQLEILYRIAGWDE